MFANHKQHPFRILFTVAHHKHRSNLSHEYKSIVLSFIVFSYERVIQNKAAHSILCAMLYVTNASRTPIKANISDQNITFVIISTSCATYA